MWRSALILAVLAAAPAQASTLTSRDSLDYDTRGQATRVVTYVVAGTEGPDSLDVTWESGVLRIHDPAGVSGDAEGCRHDDGATVRCDLGNRAAPALEADLGAGDDAIRFPSMYRARVVGGDGDDRLQGPGGVFEGGPGDDQLIGVGTGSEDMDGGPGADVLDPGKEGSDRLLYAQRTAGVTVDAGGDSAAGEAGENDVVRPGFEFVVTGAGPDRVTAAPDGTWIESGAGDDVLEGGAGWDRLETGDGADVARGRGDDDEIFGDDDFRTPGRDSLDGGEGADYVFGSAGPDAIEGGPGRDELIGGLGVDRIAARDEAADVVWCEDRGDASLSPRRDLAEVDARDFAGWCGQVRRTGAARPELLFAGERPARHRHRGVVRALVACPGRRACRATLTVLAGDRRSAGRKSFRVAPGRRVTIRVSFRLRGSAAARNASLVVRLRARDADGVIRRTELTFERRRPR